MKVVKAYIVQDSTQINDQKSFLACNSTKDSLTIYLAKQLIGTKKIKRIMTVTRVSVQTNYVSGSTLDASTQEEADTLMILHAVSASSEGYNVDIYSQDTDVLLLAFLQSTTAT